MPIRYPPESARQPPALRVNRELYRTVCIPVFPRYLLLLHRAAPRSLNPSFSTGRNSHS